MISIKSAASVTRKLFSGLAAVVLVLGLVTSAQAQQSGGSIRGTVVGADSSTVVEVMDDTRGTTKSKSTGADGSFRFDGLTTGSYEVRVLQGGNMVDSTTVNVSLGSATTVAMATTVEAIEEIVTTGTRVAALDTSIAESGLVIDAEALLELPVQRNLSSVALLAPGVSRGDYRFGGTNGKDDGNISFAGASVAENTSFINGLNTTNFRTGLGFSKVPFEFYETLQIKTGGYSAKYGRSLGGVMNARTKSGSNDFVVGANVYFDRQLDTSPETYLAANDQDDDDTTTYDVFVSGPIIKDRLFYYALYSNQDSNQRYAGQTSGRLYDYATDEGFWGVKIDAYLTDNHHIELTGFSDSRSSVEDAYNFDGTAAAVGSFVGDTVYDEGGDNWIATYTGDLTDSVTISASYGENKFSRGIGSGTAENPVIIGINADQTTSNLGNWTAFNIILGEDTREMTRFDIMWDVKSHALSAGIDVEVNTAVTDTINSGNTYWRLDPFNVSFDCTPAECPQGAAARQQTYTAGGEFETTSNSYYIQDVWEVNDNVTLELGLRNESFENLNGSKEVFVKVDNQIAPRLAVVWDPSGDGKQKFFANYGEYYLPIAANTNIRMSGNELFLRDWYDWDGTTDANDLPINLGPAYDNVIYGDGSTPDTRSTTDTNLNAMYQSEIILGYQRFLDSGVELGVKGIYRNLETTIEDVAIDAAVIAYYNDTGSWDAGLVDGDTVEDVFGGFHQYVLTNPGNAMNVYIPEQEEYIDLTAEQLGYPDVERQYAALEFSYNRPFDGRWGLGATYTWAHSWGNHEGYVKSDNGQDDAGITQNFDQPGLTDFSGGNLPNDRRNTVKAYGTYQLENGLRFGASMLYQSGRPMNCFGVHPTDDFAAAYQNSSHFCQGVGVKRGTAGQTPDITNVDLNMQYNMDLGATNVLFSLDIFNLFNAANATVFNEYGDTSGGAVNTNYQKVIQYQLPRSLRLSARLRF